ncbi:MAG: MerC domain-containing protein [Bacteroidota bacterium]
MATTFNFKRSDTWGALASGLCLIHCVATPFIFIAHAGAHEHGHEHGHAHASPLWWGTIDIIFLAVSLLAVAWSARNTSKNWMRYALIGSWLGLALVIINEKVGLLHLPEEAIYLPALALVGLHLYNRRYCQCDEEECCDVPQPNAQTL